MTLLRELGCELGQGYHFAKPLPSEEMTVYLGVTFGARLRPVQDKALSIATAAALPSVAHGCRCCGL